MNVNPSRFSQGALEKKAAEAAAAADATSDGAKTSVEVQNRPTTNAIFKGSRLNCLYNRNKTTHIYTQKHSHSAGEPAACVLLCVCVVLFML